MTCILFVFTICLSHPATSHGIHGTPDQLEKLFDDASSHSNLSQDVGCSANWEGGLVAGLQLTLTHGPRTNRNSRL